MLFKILDNRLATAGISQFSYKVLNEGLHQTNKYENAIDSWQILDVRDLFDDDSNSLKDYKEKIDLAWDMIQKHGKVVVCCVAGISRSNAIALGVLVKYFNMDFYEAWELVNAKVPIANIDPGHIEKLKKLFNVTLS